MHKKKVLFLIFCLMFLLISGCGAIDKVADQDVKKQVQDLLNNSGELKDYNADRGSDSKESEMSESKKESDADGKDATVKESDEKSDSSDQSETSDTDDENESVFANAKHGYYFRNLSDDEKKVYNEIYMSIIDRKTVTVSTLSVDTIEKANSCVLNDHPEIFYVSGYTYTSKSRSNKLVSIDYNAKYVYDENESEQLQKQIDTAVSAVLKDAPKAGSDFDKIRYVYDTIVKNTDYNMDSRDNQNILSVLLFNESVCQGYTKTTQLLLTQLGIEITLVSGDTENGAHSWNLVKSDGDWYYLDTTWGDADFQIENGQGTSSHKRPVSYDYFLVDRKTIEVTHDFKETIPLPECFATKDNYFVHENLYLNALSTDLLELFFDDAYAKGEDVVQFRCANEDVFSETKNYLIDEQHIFDYIDADGSISFVTFEDTNSFCFWLFN